jgi:hypothetical protein
MIGATMDYKVELVARTFYEADQEAYLWANETAFCKEEFREFARNVINLVNEDISVLPPASENASAEERVRSMR